MTDSGSLLAKITGNDNCMPAIGSNSQVGGLNVKQSCNSLNQNSSDDPIFESNGSNEEIRAVKHPEVNVMVT
jgi:hypothetical protein